MEVTAPAKVAILDFEPGKHFAEPDLERQILGDTVELELIRARAPELVSARLVDADVVIVWSRFELDATQLAHLRRCRGIVCASVGHDHIDLQAAAQRNIPVCNVPDYGTEEVADHAMALLLALARKLRPLDVAIREGTWDWKASGTPRRLRGQRVGIVGFGRIGTAFARRAQAFGLQVGFYDPFVPSGIDKAHAVTRYETLPALCDDVDIVSLHAALTEHSTHLFDRAAFDRLRPNALLINTARGRLVDTDALVHALDSGRLAGAGLDVLDEEPRVPIALIRHPRVVLTPHSAWSSTEAFTENRQKAAAAALRLLRGQPLRDVVNGVCPSPQPTNPT